MNTCRIEFIIYDFGKGWSGGSVETNLSESANDA